MKNENDLLEAFKNAFVKTTKELDNKVPVRKGCKNEQCFCTGKCNEIIGWRDKLINEI
jgi:hypothetical protein